MLEERDHVGEALLGVGDARQAGCGQAARRIELQRLLECDLGFFRLVELVAIGRAELGEQRRAPGVAVGDVDRLQQHLGRAACVAALRVDRAQRLGRLRCVLVDVERALVARDRGVAIAAVLQQLARAHPELGLLARVLLVLGQALDGVDRRRDVARGRAQARQLAQRAFVLSVDRQHLLVHLDRAIGRADLDREHARGL